MVHLNEHGSMERTIALTEINATLHRYASTARNGDDWDLKAAEFSPDARILLPNGISLPPDRMKEIMGGGEAKYYRHHITAIDVRFVSEREAKATCQVFVISDMSTCDHWGEWQDIMVRGETGRWWIAEKRLVVDGWDPKGWYAMMFDQV